MENRDSAMISWPKINYCRNSQHNGLACDSLNKFFNFFFKSGLDSRSNKHILLLYLFFITAIALCVAVVIAIVEPDQMILTTLRILFDKINNSRRIISNMMYNLICVLRQKVKDCIKSYEDGNLKANRKASTNTNKNSCIYKNCQ